MTPTVWMLWLPLAVSPQQPPAQPAAAAKLPSVAVMRMEAKKGVDSDVAELLSGNLAAKLRASNHFSRVVSAKEIENLVGFETQRQMMACDSTSCTSEIAAALGVDSLVAGSVGRLGDRWLINITMTSTKLAHTEGAVSRQVPGTNEGALVAAMPSMVDELLGQGKFAGAPTAPSYLPNVTSPRGAASARVTSAYDEEEARRGGMLGKLAYGLSAAGGAGMVTAVVAAPVAAIGALASGGIVAGNRSGFWIGKSVGRVLPAAFVGGLLWTGGVLAAAVGTGLVGSASLGVGLLLR